VEPLIQLRNLEKVVEAGPNKFYLLRRINLDIHTQRICHHHGPFRRWKVYLLSIIGMLDGAWNRGLTTSTVKLSTAQRQEAERTA